MTKEEIFEKVRQIVSDQFDVDKDSVRPDTIVGFEYEADSLDAVEVMMACEKKFKISIPDELLNCFSAYSTINDISETIKKILDGKVLVYFTSYSTDNYYMVTSNPDVKKMRGEEFCRTFIPDEYNGWEGKKFKYGRFKVYPIKDDGSCNIPYEPCNGTSMMFPIREQDIIDTTKMEDDKVYFSDEMSNIGAYIACSEPY